MNKFLLGGASALAFFALGSTANAQVVEIDLDPSLFESFSDVGVYINAAVNANTVDGSVTIGNDGILGSGIGSANLLVEDSAALAVAVGQIEADILPVATVGVDGLALGVANGAQVGLDLSATSALDLGTFATTAIGAVNDGTIAIGATEITAVTDGSTFDLTGGTVSDAISSSASNAATSNTSAAAAAFVRNFEAAGPTADIDLDFAELTTSGPQAGALALNTAFNLAAVDASVTINAGIVSGAASDTTAIGAVNTGTITNGLPGDITIVVD